MKSVRRRVKPCIFLTALAFLVLTTQTAFAGPLDAQGLVGSATSSWEKVTIVNEQPDPLVVPEPCEIVSCPGQPDPRSYIFTFPPASCWRATHRVQYHNYWTRDKVMFELIHNIEWCRGGSGKLVSVFRVATGQSYYPCWRYEGVVDETTTPNYPPGTGAYSFRSYAKVKFTSQDCGAAGVMFSSTKTPWSDITVNNDGGATLNGWGG